MSYRQQAEADGVGDVQLVPRWQQLHRRWCGSAAVVTSAHAHMRQGWRGHLFRELSSTLGKQCWSGHPCQNFWEIHTLRECIFCGERATVTTFTDECHCIVACIHPRHGIPNPRYRTWCPCGCDRHTPGEEGFRDLPPLTFLLSHDDQRRKRLALRKEGDDLSL